MPEVIIISQSLILIFREQSHTVTCILRIYMYIYIIYISLILSYMFIDCKLVLFSCNVISYHLSLGGGVCEVSDSRPASGSTVFPSCSPTELGEWNCRAGSRDLKKGGFLVTPIATPTQIGVVMGMALLFE